MKIKLGGENSHERDIHHKNSTSTLSQNFGSAKHFVPRNLKGESKSNRYTDIQSKYVGNINKMKLFESRVIDNDMVATFIVPYWVDEY